MLSPLRLRTAWKQASMIQRSYKAATQLPDLTKVNYCTIGKICDFCYRHKFIGKQDRYQVKRGDYAQVTDADVGFFQSILENCRVLLDESDTQSYNIDFMKSVRGRVYKCLIAS